MELSLHQVSRVEVSERRHSATTRWRELDFYDIHGDKMITVTCFVTRGEEDFAINIEEEKWNEY